jgi:ATP-dependent helicase HrpA
MRFAQGALLEAIGGVLHQISGVAVPADAWRLDALEPHFRMRFQVVDGTGATLGAGRDLGALQARFSGPADAEFQALPRSQFERVGLCSWDFDDLPERVELQGPGWRVTAYPALTAESDGVAVRVFDTPLRAEQAHREGVLRLLALQAGLDRAKLGRRLPGIQRMCLQYAGLGSCQTLQADLIDTALEQAFLTDKPLPRVRLEFDTLLASGESRFASELDRIALVVAEVLEQYVPIRKRVQGAVSPKLLQALADIRSQLDHLVYAGFVRCIPLARLAHYPRYLQGLAVRLEKLEQDPGRDRARAQRVAPLWAACLQQIGRYPGDESPPPALLRYRWLLEEYRVSIFAQELGTAEPVSEQRLAALWRTAV